MSENISIYCCTVFLSEETNKIQLRNLGYLFAVKSYSSVGFNFHTIPKFILLAHVS